MSYFFKTTGICTSNSINRKQPKYSRQLKCKKSVLKLNDFIHNWKLDNNKKYILNSNIQQNESFTNNCKVVKLYLKTKSKHYLYKKIVRLIKENNTLSLKLKQIKVSQEKNKLLWKLKKKYQKLKQNYYNIQTYYNEANTLLIYQEKKFKQLYMHHRKCVLIIKVLEQKQNSIITIIDKLKFDNAQLQENVKLLKNVIFCLNLEIENNHDKLKIPDKVIEKRNIIDIIDKINDFEKKDLIKTWGKINFHIFGPLLNICKRNIHEKDKLIQRYQNELDIFTAKFKDVINENNNLHIEIGNIKIKYHGNIHEIKLIEKDVNVIKERNSLLNKQLTIQKQKIEEIHSNYKIEVEFLYQNNSKLNKENLNCKNELKNLKYKYNILNINYEKLKNNLRYSPTSVDTSTKENKYLYEELNNQYIFNKQLNTSIKYFKAIKSEIKNPELILITECNHLKNQIRNLEKNLKQVQCKVHYLQSIINLIKLSRDSLKCQLIKTTSYCEKLIRDQEKFSIQRRNLLSLLKKRETENVNMQYFRSNIIHKIRKLKSQIKIIQKRIKEQFASVEKYISNYKLNIYQMDIKNQRELQRFKKLIEHKEKIIQYLQQKKETMQDNFESLWKAAITDNKN